MWHVHVHVCMWHVMCACGMWHVHVHVHVACVHVHVHVHVREECMYLYCLGPSCAPSKVDILLGVAASIALRVLFLCCGWAIRMAKPKRE